jgi:hypothetical protein
MVGGSGGRESRPQYVQNEWSVASEFLKGFKGMVCLQHFSSSVGLGVSREVPDICACQQVS